MFASIGLYPVIPGVGGFSMNIPQFQDILINLPNKKELLIKRNSSDGLNVKSLTFNNTPHNSTWILWDKIKNGGTLNFEVIDKNNSNWGKEEKPPSFK